MQTDNQVKKIKEYLQGKIDNLKKKKQEYETPMMSDLVKNSPHLQLDYIRITSQLQECEDNLLAIEKFSDEPTPKKKAKKDEG